MSSESNVQMTQPDDCTICFEPLDNNVDDRTIVTLRRCGHQFHLDCIGSAYNSQNQMKCPLCRRVEEGQWLLVNSVACSSVNGGVSSSLIHVASSPVNETHVSRLMHYYDQIGVPPLRFEGPIVIREKHFSLPPPRTPYIPHLIIHNGNGGEDGSSSARDGASSSSARDGASNSTRGGGSSNRGDGASSSGGDGTSSSGEGNGRSHG